MVGGKARLIYENISLQPVPGAHSSKGGIWRDRGVGIGIIDYPRNTPTANTGSPESQRLASSILQTDRRNHGVYIYPIVHSFLWRSAPFLRGSDED